MCDLEKVIRSSLDTPNFSNFSTMTGTLSQAPSKEIYWLFTELENLVLGSSSLDQVLDKFQHGQEALLSLDDPLPFFALHYLQLPILFGQAIYSGQVWNKLDLALKQGGHTNFLT